MYVREKKALTIIYLVSGVIFLTVAILTQVPKSEVMPGFVAYLPHVNAAINSMCTILLVTSWFCIKRGKVSAHRNLNLATFALSSLFLISYVVFHAFGVETRYPSDHPVRLYYLILLLSHIVFAAVVLPLVLISFYFALTGQINRHKKIVKFSFPIWLYVTTTGVIVYLMISPYYTY